jgi:very-short-patch-repair endonuclease
VALRTIDGLPTTSPTSTWAQLGAVLSVRDLVAVGDAIVRVPRVEGGTPGHPASALGTVAQLEAAIAAGRRVGINRLREALPLIRAGSSSRPESHLRLDLLERNLPTPVLDFEVRDGQGRLLGISELAFPRFRVVVEYEGDHHRVDKLQWNRDIEKYRAYAAAGWAVVRITAANLYGDAPSAAALVRDALWAAGWRPA